MKKTLIVLMMAALAVSLFVSCNNSAKEPTTHTVTLMYDEETSESFKVLDGEKFVLPESKGDKAIASFKDGEGTYAAGKRITVTKDMILTAVFKTASASTPSAGEKTYFSVVVISKDTVVDSQVIESGNKYTLPAAPNGVGFKGWQVGEDTTTKDAGTEVDITANTVIRAVWEAEAAKEYFTVVVISKDSVVETKYLEKNTEYALPAAPTGTGFNGWKVGDDAELKTAGTKIKITADTTVKADWTAEQAPVYHSLVVISKENVIKSEAVVSGTKYTLPTNSEARFKTWSVNGTETAAETEITVSADTTVKAVFEAETPVTYYAVVVLNKEILVDSKAVAGNSTYILPEAPTSTREFAGWKVGSDTVLKNVGAEIKITENTTITCEWKSYEVGDSVSYGKYPEDYAVTALQGQSITWKVLSIDTTNSRMLVISENILEKRSFDADSENYSGSDIQTYLRGDFITTYGLDKSIMCNVDVTTAIETTTVGSGDDKVFLLSLTEVNTYFGTVPQDSGAYEDFEEFQAAQKQAQDKRVAKYDGAADYWWLRSKNANGWPYPAVITNEGYDSMTQETNLYGVRPAMWVTF